MAQGKSKRGFAAMSKEKQREIARKGGKASRGRRNKDQDQDRLSSDDRLFEDEY